MIKKLINLLNPPVNLTVDIVKNLLSKNKRFVNKTFIHCSASDNSAHDDVSVIRQWHQQRGWKDVGYHFFIKKDGTIQRGRPLDQIPAAQVGFNSGSIAICLHGLLADKFTESQFISLRLLADAIEDRYNGNVTFHGHCEVSSKNCPVFDYIKVLNLDSNGYLLG